MLNLLEKFENQNVCVNFRGAVDTLYNLIVDCVDEDSETLSLIGYDNSLVIKKDSIKSFNGDDDSVLIGLGNNTEIYIYVD